MANWKKTLSEKKKLLVTGNFSLSHYSILRLELQTHKNQALFGKGLTHYHTPHFDTLKIYSYGKHFSQCFLPYAVLIFHFKCSLKCCLQFVSIWTSLKFCRLVIGYLSTKVTVLTFSAGIHYTEVGTSSCDNDRSELCYW